MVFHLDKRITTFPSVSMADEDGLLAIGGDLSTERLLTAYSNGIFPWYSEETPILWYAPKERFVLFPDMLKVSKSMSKIFARNTFEFTFDRDFSNVMRNCSSIVRRGQEGTWIVEDMLAAYNNLHEAGYAHSVEVWQSGELVGGLYGVLIGKVFCGESMFSKVANASKAALIYLCQNFDLSLIDCQIYSEHLESMGAQTISAEEFRAVLARQQYSNKGLKKLFTLVQ